MIYPQELAPTDRHDNPESSCVVSRNVSFAGLSNFNLDRQISQLNQTVESALDAHRQAEQTAVETAWHLGRHLLEKKSRLKHGEWATWLGTTTITDKTASKYMRIAHIGPGSDLGPSINATIRMLQAQDDAAPPVLAPTHDPLDCLVGKAPGDDAPPVLAPEVVKAEGEAALVWINKWLAAHEAKRAQVQVIEGEAVEVEVIPPDDSASIISDLECELAEAQERVAIMEDGSDPKGREVYTKINNQAELIKTLKSSVALWQTKHADVMAQLKALKRRNKALEAAAAKAIVPTGEKHGA